MSDAVITKEFNGEFWIKLKVDDLFEILQHICKTNSIKKRKRKK